MSDLCGCGVSGPCAEHAREQGKSEGRAEGNAAGFLRGRVLADNATLRLIPEKYRVKPTTEEPSSLGIAVGASIKAMLDDIDFWVRREAVAVTRSIDIYNECQAVRRAFAKFADDLAPLGHGLLSQEARNRLAAVPITPVEKKSRVVLEQRVPNGDDGFGWGEGHYKVIVKGKTDKHVDTVLFVGPKMLADTYAELLRELEAG